MAVLFVRAGAFGRGCFPELPKVELAEVPAALWAAQTLLIAEVVDVVLSTDGALNFLKGIFGAASWPPGKLLVKASPDFARSALRRAGFFLGFFDAASCGLGGDAATG